MAMETNSATSGTPSSGCPTWDGMGISGDLPPFFKPTEDMKRNGFEVIFLSDGPRRETENNFDKNSKDLWFDISYQDKEMTWTISQISLLSELKKHSPLKEKILRIRLVPVTEEFRKKRPKYRGSERYQVEEIRENRFDKIDVEELTV